MKIFRFIAKLAATILAAATILCAVLAAAAVVVLSSGFFPAPAWLREPIEVQIQSQFGSRTVDLGEVGISLRIPEFLPIMQVKGLHLLDSDGTPLIEVGELDIEFAIGPLLNRQVRPTAIEVRDAVAKLSLPFPLKADFGAEESQVLGQSADREGVPRDNLPSASRQPALQGAVQNVLAALDSGPLASTLEVLVDGATVEVLSNDGSEVWRFSEGWALVKRSATKISGEATISFPTQLGSEGGLALRLDLPAGQMEPRIEIEFQNLQVDPLASKIFGTGDQAATEFVANGAVGIQIDETGKLRSIDADVQTGQGVIHAPQVSRPVNVSSAHVIATYTAATERIDVSALSINSEYGSVSAGGSAYVVRGGSAESAALLGSFHLDEMILHPPGAFQEQLDSISGYLEFRLRPGIRALEFAQISVAKDTTKLVASGTLTADAAGLEAALDFQADHLTRDNLLAWWPVTLVPKPRAWLLQNLHEGEFSNVVGSFRHSPGSKPELLLTFRAREMALRYLKTLPPIRGGIGHASLTLKEFNLGLEAGSVTVPDFGDISLAGSSFHIPDIGNARESSEVRLQFDSRMGPVLAVLDYPPFRFLEAAGIPPDIVNGRASGVVNLHFPLLKSIAVKDVQVRADGTITDYSSKGIMGGRTFFGESLDVQADNFGIKISGEGVLGSIPVSGVWSQEFGPDSSAGSSIVGSLKINDALLNEFDISLQEQTLSGTADARFYVSFSAGAPPSFVVTSDLRGVAINFPFLRWEKPAGASGEFIIEGKLQHPIALDRIDFAANSLAIRGRATLLPSGELESATFDHVGLSNWLDVTALVSRESNGELIYKVTGGVIYFQKSSRAIEFSNFAESGSSQVDLTLDRLELSSRIALTDLSGRLGAANRELNQFSANLNGGPRVNLKLVRTRSGPAVRVGSSNAGEVLRALKFTRNLHGGTLEALFAPLPGGNGFRGILEIRDAIARNMPTLSEILSYVSVVGLIDKLATDGISFDAINADFDMSETEIALRRGTAVGQSLGITMRGNFDLSSSEVNLVGVVTPAYALNRLIDTVTPISTILGIEEGEGLGAVDYVLRGPVDDLEVAVNPISAVTPGFLRDLFPSPSAER